MVSEVFFLEPHFGSHYDKTGVRLQDLAVKCSKDFWPTVLIEMLVWPPFQVVKFARVPLRHQLVVMNGGTILDSAFICWCA